MSYDADSLARRQSALNEKRIKYEHAKSRIGLADFLPALDLVFSYKKGDPPEAALFILAQCQVLLREARELCNTITHYERELANLNKLSKLIPVDNG